jgi:hypothetical protein
MQQRDFAAGDVEGKLVLMTLRELFLPGQAVQGHQLLKELGRLIIRKLLRLVGFKGTLQWGTDPKADIFAEAPKDQSVWIIELEVFRTNIMSLCDSVGSQVDKLATIQEITWRLRKYASEGKLALSPLFQRNAELEAELAKYKRINASLQTRHTIENLVANLPDDFPKAAGTGGNWKLDGTMGPHLEKRRDRP